MARSRAPSQRRSRKPGNKRTGKQRSIPPTRDEIEALVGLYRAGRFEQAVASARRFVDRWPDMATGWNVLGTSYQGLARPAEAVTAYRHALAIEPDNPATHNNLGMVLADLGRFEEAESAYGRALELHPKLVSAYNNLGNLYRQQGRTDEAETSFRRALEVRPDYAEAHSNWAGALLASGRFDDAETRYRHALTLQPRRIDFHINLIELLRQTGRIEEAEEMIRSAITSLGPDARLYRMLGLVLRDHGRITHAEWAFEQAIENEPGRTDVYYELGDMLADHGRIDEAERWYRRAVDMNPGSARSHRQLAVMLATAGNLVEAGGELRRAIKIQPAYADAYYQLASIETLAVDGPEIRGIEDLLSSNDLSTIDRARLHYAAGRVHAASGRSPEQAFHHFQQANESMRQSIEYSIDEDESRLARVAEAFPAGVLSGTNPCTDRREVPVFIVGMPRSGTTLVEQILASHPEVHAAGERTEIRQIVRGIGARMGRDFPAWIPEIAREDIDEAACHYYQAVMEPASDARRVVDKMPDNFRFLGLIAWMFPRTRIVHVLRDPIDTCVSCFENMFAPGRLQWSYDLGEMGRYYRAYARLMDHWRHVLDPGMLLEIKYEELVSDPEAGIRRLVDHCGLDWDPRCLAFHETSRVVPTPSFAQVRRPMYDASVGRGRRYGDNLKPLLDALGPLVS